MIWSFDDLPSTGGSDVTVGVISICVVRNQNSCRMSFLKDTKIPLTNENVIFPIPANLNSVFCSFSYQKSMTRTACLAMLLCYETEAILYQKKTSRIQLSDRTCESGINLTYGCRYFCKYKRNIFLFDPKFENVCLISWCIVI